MLNREFLHYMKGFYTPKFVFFLIFIFFSCINKITYKLEILNTPVGANALNKTSYTEIRFYAYNIETDFSGYKISVGNTKSEALSSSTVAQCLFSKNSNLNRPTRVQLGGTAQSGVDCYIANVGPLANATWVSIRSFGSRDCSQYPSDSGCSNISDAASAEVLPFIDAPSSATVVSQGGYYLVTLTMGTVIPANFNGLGIFYSPNKDEAEFRASNDGSIVDGFCSLATPASGAILTIQMGGVSTGGASCFVPGIVLNSGDTVAIRNSVSSRTQYPWSEFVSVAIP